MLFSDALSEKVNNQFLRWTTTNKNNTLPLHYVVNSSCIEIYNFLDMQILALERDNKSYMKVFLSTIARSRLLQIMSKDKNKTLENTRQDPKCSKSKINHVRKKQARWKRHQQMQIDLRQLVTYAGTQCKCSGVRDPLWSRREHRLTVPARRNHRHTYLDIIIATIIIITGEFGPPTAAFLFNDVYICTQSLNPSYKIDTEEYETGEKNK